MTSGETTQVPTPKRSAGKKALLFAGACVGSLLLGEVLVRLVLEPPPFVEISHRAGVRERLAEENREQTEVNLRGAATDTLWVDTPTGWRLRANTVAVIKDHHLSHRDITIRTNSLGFRNPEIGPKTRTGVLFLGDSILLGDYLDEAETFVRQVEEISSDRGRPIETINAGVGAIGLQNELAILVETGLRTDPDVVVLCFYLNDVADSAGVRLLEAPRLLAGSHLIRHAYRAVSLLQARTIRGHSGSLSEHQVERWRQAVLERFVPGGGLLRRDPGAFNAAIQDAFMDWGVAWSDGAWQRMKPTFHELRRQAQINGFKLLIVGFPVRMQVMVDYLHDYPQRRLVELANEIGVPCLDLLPAFRGVYRDSSILPFYDQCHHTPDGNRLIAEWIVEFISQHLD